MTSVGSTPNIRARIAATVTNPRAWNESLRTLAITSGRACSNASVECVVLRFLLGEELVSLALRAKSVPPR
jgi:hypothetical protein